MGNKSSGLDGVVTVSKGTTAEVKDPIEQAIEGLECDVAGFAVDENSMSVCENVRDYYVPLHRYRVNAILKDQENIIKKCENIERLSKATLSDNMASFIVIPTQLLGNKLKNSQVYDEMLIVKMNLQQLKTEIDESNQLLSILEEYIDRKLS